MGKKRTLIISIFVFLITAGCAAYLILNKGYINGKSLVPYEIIHEVSMEVDKEYLSLSVSIFTFLFSYSNALEPYHSWKGVVKVLV